VKLPDPYLEGAVRGAYDGWQERAKARFSPPLTFQEIRRGVQALSLLYVERRSGADLATRSLDGDGKRAAFALFYAPLHFLTLFHALRGRDLGAVARVVDAGCGTGASGAATALAIAERTGAPAPQIVGVDRSGFALEEARRTAAELGLRGAWKRGALPLALPALRGGDLGCLGGCANELPEAARDSLFVGLVTAVERGAGLVVAEPLAAGVTPWWRDWVAAFAEHGGASFEARARLALPAFVKQLDKAAGLDHQEIGARVLCVPVRELPSARGSRGGR
jgi:SAM-dependent methyltransferase